MAKSFHRLLPRYATRLSKALDSMLKELQKWDNRASSGQLGATEREEGDPNIVFHLLTGSGFGDLADFAPDAVLGVLLSCPKCCLATPAHMLSHGLLGSLVIACKDGGDDQVVFGGGILQNRLVAKPAIAEAIDLVAELPR